ncbi:Glutamine synthetase [Phytophthora cinnamomi]|uniref:Glutamine synthetase n=1 Tax=Phytophthora cinnamomi TaxID=4785 RepID=UPI003559A3F0|nr:Glutamine synthetase [Phytophthora cinnamomi]
MKKDSMPNVKMVVDPIEWVESPEQPDATSCGAMIVALAYNFITGKMDIQTYSISNNDVKVMRLRMLWVIMHCSQERTLSNVDAAKVDKIH